MAHFRIGILIAVLIVIVSAAPQGDDDDTPVACKTPTGKSGTCVHYYFCDPGYKDFDIDLDWRQCADYLDICCPGEFLKDYNLIRI
ncbi:unnamed protein product, partial [Brenthis ino]